MTFRCWFALGALICASLLGHAGCRWFTTQRGQEELLNQAALTLARLPEVIGNWRAAPNPQPIEVRALAQLGCRAHVDRIYVHDETGERVSLILLAGQAGPLAVHTPAICYASADFQLVEAAHPVPLRASGQAAAPDQSGEDQFRVIRFQRTTIPGEHHKVYYAWALPGSVWVAPAAPRVALAGAPMLYKLQVAVAGTDLDQVPEAPGDAAARFLADLLPAWRALLR